MHQTSRLPLRFFQIIATVFVGALFSIGCGQSGEDGAASNDSSDEIVIAMMPKLVGIDYFVACEKGAQKAADDLGVKLIYDGPATPSGEEQNNYIDTWIRNGVDAICIAPNQPKRIKPFVDKARAAGITVLTWDSDAPDSGRQYMVNQVDDKVLGESLMDEIARQMNEEGEWAIAIASLDAANLNTWRSYAEARAAEKYPQLKLVETVITKENETEAAQKVGTLLNAHPNLKGIIAFDSNSVPGAAEAIKRAGKIGQVALTGNSTPGKMRPYIKEGVLESFFLWDPNALGELTVRIAKAAVEGQELKEGDDIPGYGNLRFSPRDDQTIILSDPIRFTAENIDEYDFGF